MLHLSNHFGSGEKLALLSENAPQDKVNLLQLNTANR